MPAVGKGCCDEEGHSVFCPAQKKFCEVVQNLNCSLAGPVLLSTSKKVSILDECVGNTCFLFLAPEEA